MRIVYAVVLLALLSAPVHADEWMTGITYNISFPGSEIKEFTNESPSWRGLGFEVKKFVTPAFSVGGSVDWTVFKEETVEQITIRTEDLNGDIIFVLFPVDVVPAEPMEGNPHHLRAGEDYEVDRSRLPEGWVMMDTIEIEFSE